MNPTDNQVDFYNNNPSTDIWNAKKMNNKNRMHNPWEN